jgi:hypothetical protein
MKKWLIILLNLFFLAHTDAQSYEIRTSNGGANLVLVQMRCTAAPCPVTSNYVLDLVFGLKWLNTLGVNLGSPTGSYDMAKSGGELINGTYEFQAFGANNAPYTFPASWPLNTWVTVMSISYSQSGTGTPAFLITEGGFHKTTNVNINIDGVDFTPVINNCTTESSYYADTDNDGYGAGPAILSCTQPPNTSTNNTDCNDTNAAIKPGATELCNGVDDNCDNIVDNIITCPQPSGLLTSNISYNSATISWTSLPCAVRYEYRYRYLISPGMYSGYTSWFSTVPNTANLTGLTSATTYQWVVRAICSNNNTSAAIVSSFTTCTPFVYYVDADGDGYGTTTTGLSCSLTPPAGLSSNNQDCNDAIASIHPGAPELCNGIDDNCDNVVENVTVCPAPSGLVTTNISYNSATISWASVPCAIKYEYRYRYLISPGVYSSYTAWFPVFTNTVNLTGLSPATTYQWIVRSICSNNITSTAVPSSFTTCVPVIYYADTDGDGFGNPATSIQGCSATPPAGYQTNSTDCNDGVTSIHPGAPELCDGIDNDCDGLIAGDEGTTYYQDSDGDGFGNPAMTALSCTTAPLGYVSGATDCNDNLANTYPGATELCDGVDNNCDNIVDNVSTCPKPTGLAVANVMMTTATISWNVIPCAVNGYQYRLRIKTGSTWSNYGPWIATPTNSVNLMGLSPVTTYQYQARTKCYGNNKFSTVVNGPQFTTLASMLLSEGSTAMPESPFETGYKASIFPNPTDGKFTTAIMSELSGVRMELTLMDGVGRILKRIQLVLEKGINEQEVDLRDYPDAIYYIELRTEKGISHYPVMKSGIYDRN